MQEVLSADDSDSEFGDVVEVPSTLDQWQHQHGNDILHNLGSESTRSFFTSIHPHALIKAYL